MNTHTSPSIEDAAHRVAKVTSLDPEVVKQAIFDAIKLGNLGGKFGFLAFHGILPVQLPDGLRLAVLPDLHAPAHHEQILWAVKAFLADYQPHILVLIGDAADAFGLSAWPTSPRMPQNLMGELGETRELIDELIEVSGALWCFITMGNHEDRARRWLMNFGSKIAGVSGLRNREPILNFHELLEYTPQDKITFIYDLAGAGGFGGGLRLNQDLLLIHGYMVRPRPGASPRGTADLKGKSVTHGHTHRLAANYREITSGIIRSHEIGNLVNPSHHMMSYANLMNNWHPGLAVGTVVGGKVHLEIIPIIQYEEGGRYRYVFAFGDKEYRSADR